MNSSGSASLNDVGAYRLDTNWSELRKQYYNLPVRNEPYEIAVRNALFNEPLVHRSPLSFSDFRPETYPEMWKKQYSNKKTTKISEKIDSYLQSQCRMSLLDDYYSNCLSSKGHFVSYANVNTIYTIKNDPLENSKLIMKHTPSIRSEEIITALQVDNEGNNYFGTNQGSCYAISQELQNETLLFSQPDTKNKICSMALLNDFLYISSVEGNVNIISLKDNVKRKIFLSEFACRILPQIKPNHYLALGHNENKVSIYDDRQLRAPVTEYRCHNAAVRALAWNPTNPNEIASGGGAADKEIHIWDITTGQFKYGVCTKAQICNLFWTEWEGKQYITSIKGNDLSWNKITPASFTISKLENNSFKSQTSFTIDANYRPIHSVINENDPCQLIVGGKEYLQMWRIFESKPAKNHEWSCSDAFSPYTIR